MIPELDSGKGYADIAFLPQPEHADRPALVVELKYDRDADTALSQIRSRNYPARLRHYANNMLLVGVNYDKEVPAGCPATSTTPASSSGREANLQMTGTRPPVRDLRLFADRPTSPERTGAPGV